MFFEHIIQIQSYRQIFYKHAENIQLRDKIIKLSQILGVMGIFQLSIVHILKKSLEVDANIFECWTPLQKDCYDSYIVIQKNVSQILRHITL